MDQPELPSQVRRVLQPGVHAVALGGRTECAASPASRTGPAGTRSRPWCDSGNVSGSPRRRRTPMGGTGGSSRWRRRPDPTPASSAAGRRASVDRERGEDDRDRLEIDEGEVEHFRPSVQRRIEDRPRRGDVVAVESDAARFACLAVQTVAPHHPTGVHPDALAVAFDLGHDAVGASSQTDQARRSGHLAALRVQVLGEDGLRDLLGHAEAVRIAAPGAGEVECTEDLAARMDLRAPLGSAHVEKLLAESQGFEELGERGCTTVARSQCCGPDRSSISRHGTSRRLSSAARSSPVGPAPTTSTGARPVVSSVTLLDAWLLIPPPSPPRTRALRGARLFVVVEPGTQRELEQVIGAVLRNEHVVEQLANLLQEPITR